MRGVKTWLSSILCKQNYFLALSYQSFNTDFKMTLPVILNYVRRIDDCSVESNASNRVESGYSQFRKRGKPFFADDEHDGVLSFKKMDG